MSSRSSPKLTSAASAKAMSRMEAEDEAEEAAAEEMRMNEVIEEIINFNDDSGTTATAARPPPPPAPPAPPKKIRKKMGTFHTGDVTAIAARPTFVPKINELKWKKTMKGSSGFILTEEYINYREGRIYLTRDTRAGNAKEYNSVDSWEDLLHDILGRDPASIEHGFRRNFYEFFRENQRVKLYFDFEIKGPFGLKPNPRILTDSGAGGAGAGTASDDFLMNNTQFDDIALTQSVSSLNVRPTDEDIHNRIEQICRRAILKIRELYDISIDIDWFAVLNSSNADKISYHIVLTKGIYFMDCSHLKNFFNIMFPKEVLNAPIEYPSFIGLDAAVYGNGRQLRLPLCSKGGEVRPLKIDDRFTFQEQMVSHCPLDTFEVKLESGEVEVRTSPIVQQAIPKKRATGNNGRTGKAQAKDDDDPKLSDNLHCMLEELLMTIPPRFAENYEVWIQTGMKLKRAGGTLEMWEKWSEGYFKWKLAQDGEESQRVDKLKSRWVSFDSTNDLHTFFNWIDRYGDSKMLEQYKKSSLEYVGILHNDISDAFHIANPQHVFSNASWWFFDGVRWCKDNEGMWISKSIHKWQRVINNKIRDNKEKLKDMGYADEDDDDQVLYAGKKRALDTDSEDVASNLGAKLSPEQEAEIQRLKKLNNKLRQIKKITQDNTIGNNNALKTVYFNNKFFDELDTYNDLIGFENGVYDLIENVFRDATPEDKITMSTKYNFEDPDPEAMYEVKKLLNEVYPDKSVRDYVVRFHSSLLTGRCPDECIHFYTGMNSIQTGANAKSTMDLLVMKVLGDYAVVGHPSLLTGARESASSANSALMALRMKRYVSFQEINDSGTGKVTLNMSIIKGLTGNDPQSGRELFQPQSRPFEPTWKIVVSANKLPPMSNDDGGARRRVRDIPHEAKFVANPSDPIYEGMPNVFPVNLKLKDKIKSDPAFRLAYLHILLEEHVEFRKEGLLDCPRIEAHTTDYLDNQDLYCGWIRETFERTEEETDILEVAVLKYLFRMQKKDIESRGIKVKPNDFIVELSQPRRLGKLDETKSFWKGWRLQDSNTARAARDYIRSNNVKT